MQIGKSLVLYRAEEHRVLELLKNLALGRVFQHMQACTLRSLRTLRTLRSLLHTHPRSAIAYNVNCVAPHTGGLPA